MSARPIGEKARQYYAHVRAFDLGTVSSCHSMGLPLRQQPPWRIKLSAGMALRALANGYFILSLTSLSSGKVLATKPDGLTSPQGSL